MSTPMNKVSSLLSGDISNYLSNKQTWGNIIVNVLAYEAKGDGETNDVYAINKASQYLYENGGGVLYFPPGTYYIDNGGSQVYTPSASDYAGKRNLLLRPNIVMAGAGRSSIIKFKNIRNNFLFPYDGTTALSINNIIRDLAMCSEYTGLNPDTTDSNAIWGSMRNMLIDSCYFYDLDSDAVVLAGDTGIDSNNVTVRDCTITRTGRHGLTVIRGYNVTFENNTISNCATGSGLHVEQSTQDQPESFIKIINNRVDTAVNGFFFDIVDSSTARSLCRNVVVYGNTFQNLSGYGIRLDSLAHAMVTDNYIYNYTLAGILIGACYDVIAKGNTFYNGKGPGIYVSLGSRHKVIANHIIDDQTVPTTTVGIQVLNGANYVTVSENFIQGTLQSGIVIKNASQSHVNHNSVINSCIGRLSTNDAAILFDNSSGDIHINNMVCHNILIDNQTVATMYRGINMRGTSHTGTIIMGNTTKGYTAGDYIFSDAFAQSNLS